MSSQFENFAGIFRLALDGKKEEAINAVMAERARLTAFKAELTDKLANADKDLTMLNTILPPEASKHVAPPPPPKGTVNSVALARDTIDMAKQRISDAKIKEKRDSAIINAAKELGGTYAQFTTVSIANELKSKGIETGVPENRISTVISRLLLRHEQEFEKVETGMYKLRNA